MAEMNATYNADLRDTVASAKDAGKEARRLFETGQAWLTRLIERSEKLAATATSLNDDLQDTERQLREEREARARIDADLVKVGIELQAWKTAPSTTAFKEYTATKAENTRLTQQVQNQSDEIANLSRLLASADHRNLVLSRERKSLEDELQGAQTSMNQWRERALKAEKDLRQAQAWGMVWEKAYDANLAEREAMQALKKALQLKDYAGEPVAQLGQAWADAKTALQKAHSEAVGFFVDGIKKVQ